MVAPAIGPRSIGARRELEAVLADEGPVDQDQVEALFRATALPHTAVGVFIEVPPAAP